MQDLYTKGTQQMRISESQCQYYQKEISWNFIGFFEVLINFNLFMLLLNYNSQFITKQLKNKAYLIFIIQMFQTPSKKHSPHHIYGSCHKLTRKSIPKVFLSKRLSLNSPGGGLRNSQLSKKLSLQEESTQCSDSIKSQENSRVFKIIEKIRRIQSHQEQIEQQISPLSKNVIKKRKQKLIRQFKSLKIEGERLKEMKEETILRNAEEYVQIMQRVFETRKICNKRAKQIEQIKCQLEMRMAEVN